ncbi:MAG: FAD-binding oxidoreductase [Gammaproteobacteria bacterium]|nr:FAD-binding oxidoreductase [Gammaproteobacteria bacterium]
MIEQTKDKIAVIGAGIIGLCSALRLQKMGFQVTIFDGNGVSNGASFGNAGHFATEQVFPLADPSLLPKIPRMLIDPLGPICIRPNYILQAIPWFLRFFAAMGPAARVHNTAAITKLNDQSLTQWKLLLKGIDGLNFLTMQGSLLTYEAGSIDNLAADYLMYRAKDVAVDMIDQDQVQTLEPLLSDQILGALYFTDVGHTISPINLSQCIFSAFTEAGGRLVAENIDRITTQFNPIIVESDQQSYTFDKLVICAGAYAKALTAQIGYQVPLEVERGYHLMVPMTQQLNRPVASNDRKFIMTPMQEGLRLAGTVEFGGLVNKADYRRSDMMLTHAKALVPQLASLQLHQLPEQARWMGMRPSLPDSLPIIDFCQKNPNVIFNFGHQHLGLTWAAISAQLITEIIAGKPSTLDLSPYRITRF